MVRVMLYPCMLSVALSMDLFVLCVACLVKQFAICLGVFVILHLSHWYVVLVCHQHDVRENYVGTVYISAYGGLSESGLCVFRELCPVRFLVVGECPSVLL